MRALLCLTIVFFVLSDANINAGALKRIQLMKAQKNKGKATSSGKDSGTYDGFGKASGTGCPPGVPMVRCFADPCTVTHCDAYPDANCTANYCGGCHAIFTQYGQIVDCGTDGTSATCPPDQPPVQCTANPCTTTTCSSCPRAHCTPNYCGGCHAIFTDDNGVVNCADDTYTCTVTYSAEGEHCGGNMVNPPQCAPGLVCTAVPGSGPFGDVGGICKPTVVCTMEAKSCPDGSYVGRDPNNNCEFSPCPTCTQAGGTDAGTVCTEDVFRCADGSFVPRDPNRNCQFAPCPSPSYGKQAKGLGSVP